MHQSVINADGAGRRGVSQQSALLSCLQHSSARLHLAQVTAPTSTSYSLYASMCCTDCFTDEKYTASDTAISEACSAALFATVLV